MLIKIIKYIKLLLNYDVQVILKGGAPLDTMIIDVDNMKTPINEIGISILKHYIYNYYLNLIIQQYLTEITKILESINDKKNFESEKIKLRGEEKILLSQKTRLEEEIKDLEEEKIESLKIETAIKNNESIASILTETNTLTNLNDLISRIREIASKYDKILYKIVEEKINDFIEKYISKEEQDESLGNNIPTSEPKKLRYYYPLKYNEFKKKIENEKIERTKTSTDSTQKTKSELQLIDFINSIIENYLKEYSEYIEKELHSISFKESFDVPIIMKTVRDTKIPIPNIAAYVTKVTENIDKLIKNIKNKDFNIGNKEFSVINVLSSKEVIEVLSTKVIGVLSTETEKKKRKRYIFNAIRKNYKR